MGLRRMTALRAHAFPVRRADPELLHTHALPHRDEVDLVNDGFSTANMLYYDIDYTLGDDIPDDALYFHAWYIRNCLPLRKDYTILSGVKGKAGFWVPASECLWIRINTASPGEEKGK